MLTSFFGKSNPINYVLVSGYMVLLALAQFFFLEGPEADFMSFVWLGVSVTALVFSMLMIDFIVRKNALTQSNSYAVVLFAGICLIHPNLFLHTKWIGANIFVLLALRRIFSLRSDQNMEKKVLDASLWLCLATLNYFWCILLFIPLVQAIHFNGKTTIRHYLIPSISAAGFVVLFAAYHLLRSGVIDWGLLWRPDLSLDFSPLYSYYNAAVTILILLTLVVALILRFKELGRIAKKERPNYLLVVYFLAACIGALVLNPTKTGGALLFIAAPLAIILSVSIEQSRKAWHKEILLWLFLLLPIVRFFV